MKIILKYCGLAALLAGAALYFSNCDGPTEPEYDGVWEVVPTPKCAGAVTDIYFVSPNDGWAVAGWGFVWRYRGNKWEKVHEFKSSKPENDVAAVTIWFENASKGWAAGHELTPSRKYHTKIWHYESATWSEVTCPDAGWVSRLWFNSPDDGWLIGGDYALRYDGEKWYKTGFPTYRWKGCFFWTADEGWATSVFGIWRWDGVNWDRVEEVNNYLRCIGFPSRDLGWAMGERLEYSGEPPVYRYDGKGWANYKGPWRAADRFYDVEFLSADYGWAVGLDSYFWDGEKWTRYELPGGEVGGRPAHCVECVNENDVWVGTTRGKILRFKGFGGFQQ